MALPTPVSSSLPTIDYNLTLYLHPSDTPGTLLVSHQLLGTDNYSVWSRSMKIALLAKNKLGLIDGTCKQSDYPPELHSQWARCNAIVLSWILNTVCKDLSAGIVFANSASVVWQDLKERFDKVDGFRIFTLHKSISSHTQGTSSISTYFTKLRLLWDDYDTLVPPSTCDCDAARKTVDHINQQRLFQLLMGLNDSYASVRRQILLLQPLPTLNQAYSMLQQDESQQELVSPLLPLPEPTALHSSSSSATKPRFTGRCDHCHLKGHKRENCYRLIGYPSDFKFTKRKPQVNNALAPALASDTESVTPKHHSPPILTTEQYQQLLQLLNKDSSSVSGSVNMAGIASAVSHSSLGWIIDTGATNHMTYDFHCLINPVAYNSANSYVQLPNGTSAKVTHIGSHPLTSTTSVSNVFYIPDFHFNLLSVAQLTKELNCIVLFYPTFCILQELCSGKMLGIGEEHAGLYFLQSSSTSTCQCEM